MQFFSPFLFASSLFPVSIYVSLSLFILRNSWSKCALAAASPMLLHFQRSLARSGSSKGESLSSLVSAAVPSSSVPVASASGPSTSLPFRRYTSVSPLASGTSACGWKATAFPRSSRIADVKREQQRNAQRHKQRQRDFSTFSSSSSSAATAQFSTDTSSSSSCWSTRPPLQLPPLVTDRKLPRYNNDKRVAEPLDFAFEEGSRNQTLVFFPRGLFVFSIAIYDPCSLHQAPT